MPRKKERAPTKAGTRTASQAPGLLRPLPICIALVLLNLFVYAAVRHFPFVNWDDPTYITDNPNISAALTWHSVVWAFTTGYAPYWHPLTWLSYFLDIEIAGMDAGAFHVTNLLLHVANTLLVFGVFRRMTGAAGRSAFVAAIFAAHPLHVESVAWVAERKDVLSTCFLLLTIGAYAAYVARPHWTRYVAVLVLFALALMAKPMVVTLPVVLLLLDVWPLGRIGAQTTWTRAILEKIPLVALTLATGVATVVIQRRAGAVAPLTALSWQFRATNAIVEYMAYLGKTVWPTHLAAFYPFRAFSPVMVAGAGLVLVVITVAALRWRRDHPYLLVGWLWYLVTVSPVIGVIQAGEQRMADRFVYIPMIGLLIIVAWGVEGFMAHGSGLRRLVPGAAVMAVLACAVTARGQVETWSDSVVLWQHAVEVTPESYVAYEKLGDAFRERGELEAASTNYHAALALAPARSPVFEAIIHNSLGMILSVEGRAAEAAGEFAAAVRLNPGFGEAQNNLGNALAAGGHFPDAIEHYRAAIAIQPVGIEAHVGLGGALLREGRASDAAAQYTEALRLDPSLAQAHNGLGAALASQGQADAAMAHYAEALRLKPDLPSAHVNMAILLIARHDTADARRHLEAALAIDPSYEPARRALAAVGSRQ